MLTPPAASSILAGITRDTVMTLAREEGIEIVEQPLPREALYVADEVFLTGTAAEITPVRSVDGIATRVGGPGPVTKTLQARFHGLFHGRAHGHDEWLEPVAESTVRRGEREAYAAA
jgi:branched-chain amino acid aminotransferase